MTTRPVKCRHCDEPIFETKVKGEWVHARFGIFGHWAEPEVRRVMDHCDSVSPVMSNGSGVGFGTCMKPWDHDGLHSDYLRSWSTCDDDPKTVPGWQAFRLSKP